MKNTLENSKLITDFIGTDLLKDLLSDNNGFININVDIYEQCKFHSDWNWLMRVVEKIENLQDENNCAIYNVKVEQCFVEIIINHTSETIVEVDCNTKIQAVYQACVEFVKWYIEQNK